MPLLHCSKCHHEWESSDSTLKQSICDWCGAIGYVLAKKTPLEILLDKIKSIGGIEKFLYSPKGDKDVSNDKT